MTLNELIEDFKAEGLSFDKDIQFYTGPSKRVDILSIYPSTDGTPVVDIGDE